MLKGLGNLANLGSIVKQAQQMGSKLKEVERQLKTQRATGSAGGGLVEVEIDGTGEVLRVRIDPSLIERADREMIEDLLPAAFNAARAKAQQMHAEVMRSVTAGLDLPDLGEMLGQVDPNDSPASES